MRFGSACVRDRAGYVRRTATRDGCRNLGRELVKLAMGVPLENGPGLSEERLAALAQTLERASPVAPGLAGRLRNVELGRHRTSR